MKTTEHAECERLAHYVNALLPALERFNNFAGPDLAGPRRAKWRALLDEPLPEHAQGLESVLSDLRESVIPNGLRIGRRNVSQIPVDAELRIDLAALEAALERDAAANLVPIAIVANAGTTNTGAVDPIAQACRHSQTRLSDAARFFGAARSRCVSLTAPRRQ